MTKERLPLTPIRSFRVFAALAVATLSVNCGSSTPTPNSINISNFQYSPASLSVTPGTTVTVTNQDGMQHSVTSQTAMNAFTPGAVNGIQFDTGAFSNNATVTIPSTATVGTVIPYYCTVHLQAMGQGQIIVIAPP